MKEKGMTMSVDKALEIAKTVTTIRIRVPGTGVISHFFLKKKEKSFNDYKYYPIN